MNKPIIYLFPEFTQTDQLAISQLAPQYDVISAADHPVIPEDRLEILLGWSRTQAKSIISAPNLRWVQTISAGVDYLPLDEFMRRHILVSNASGLHVQAISEHVLGIMLADSRGLLSFERNQLDHHWDPKAVKLTDLAEQNLLIFGAGHIGQHVAQTAHSLGLKVSGVNTSGQLRPGFDQMYTQATITEHLAEMDTIVNIMPLTLSTSHYFNLAFFKKMKSTASFINVGRGKSVVTADLVTALQQNIIRFASVDVLEEEPLASSSELWDLNHLLITPHIAGQIPHFRRKLFAIFEPNLSQYLKNQTLVKNQVNLTKKY